MCSMVSSLVRLVSAPLLPHGKRRSAREPHLGREGLGKGHSAQWCLAHNWRLPVALLHVGKVRVERIAVLKICVIVDHAR